MKRNINTSNTYNMPNRQEGDHRQCLSLAKQNANPVRTNLQLKLNSISRTKKFLRSSFSTIYFLLLLCVAFLYIVYIARILSMREKERERVRVGEGTVQVSTVTDTSLGKNMFSNTTAIETTHTYTKSNYAYVWIIGSIHETNQSYKGFLWDILISAHMLRKFGSTADFIVYTRLSPDSNLTEIPTDDARLFRELGIQVRQLDKPFTESFARLVYDKFLTIGMSEYKRVMFLDADTFPLTNLDYLFHLSDPDYKNVPTLLKPNLIIATYSEACNTGMFMVEPSDESFAKYEETVKRQHGIARTLPYPHFDFKGEGWGYEFNLTQYGFWEGINGKHFNWWFHASHSDQGLMYYFARFIQKENTIIIGDRVQNWKASNATATAIHGDVSEIESDVKGILAPYEGNLTTYQYHCDLPLQTLIAHKEKGKIEINNRWKCDPPYSSVAHFSGDKKPWTLNFDIEKMNKPASSFMVGARRKWFQGLYEINKKLDMGLDIRNWDDKHRIQDTPLGQAASYADQGDIIFNRHINNVVK